MSSDLTLYELTGSPNNVKVRIGLGYKGLEYTRNEFELDSFPGNRSSIVEMSRQPRLPLLKHGETVVFDSKSILRYLDANFPDTPTLFSPDYQTFGEIEQWEGFASTQIGECIGMIFGQAFAENQDAEVIQQANAMINERTGVIEDKVASNGFLVGDHLTAADIACAAPLYLTDLTDENAAAHPIAAFFQANLQLGDGREATRSWVRKVLAHDPIKGKR